MKRLRAAVIGVGYLGNFHVQKYLSLPEVDVVGAVETHPARAAEISAKYGFPVHPTPDPLLNHIDLVSIVTPPRHHFAAARDCLGHGIHVLVEKPVTETVLEAQALIDLARRHGCVFQVGHLERFNPAVLAVRRRLRDPHRIESRRLSKYQKRGTEVDVVLDLMIHDIDIVLSMIDSPVESMHATGSTVVSGDLDVAHATLHFANGCVADLTASRVNREPVRAMNIYQKDSYLSVDFLNHSLLVGRQGSDAGDAPPVEISFEEEALTRTDVLMDEIASFVAAVREGSAPTVTGEDGKRALEVAVAISSQIRDRQRRAQGATAG
ncbi:MAG: Gfo/Idh/MocA family protein [Gammaproteobacteria bacterium]